MLFLLPTGAAGKRFIEEMIRLENSWTYKSFLETIAPKALMIMPGLLLRKTSLNSKSKENSETMKRRLSLSKNGQLDQLMFERKTIQDTLKSNVWVTTNNNKEALTFSRLIKEGKVNKAIKILEKANTGGILPLSDETDVENTSAKTSGGFWNIGRYTTKTISQEVHPVIYQTINSETVKDAIGKTRGAAGFQEWTLMEVWPYTDFR